MTLSTGEVLICTVRGRKPGVFYAVRNSSCIVKSVRKWQVSSLGVDPKERFIALEKAISYEKL
jgi:hypothetical protein